MSVVHDASSLLTLAFNEPGSSVVRAALRGSLISSVNWSEVVQKVQGRGRDTRPLRGLFEQLGVTIEPFAPSTAELAARLYFETRQLGLSLGDRACLALGLEKGWSVYTADREWSQLPLGIEIRPIR
jgi:PIN domain nuclease of toxin-antitoxin system